MDLQFYPTPKWLAERAWDRFTDKEFVRVLDPSAGDGALCDAAPRDYWRHTPKIDCIELDASKHPILREKGWRVVGLDFLGFEAGHCYSHVIMNPPFREGARHVLKAWDMLYTGEIVAIVNAETLRNPFSAERQRLAKLVEEHGSVEFIPDAFKGEEVVREADVEIALVHLAKPAECTDDWIGPVIAGLATEKSAPAGDFELPRELALPDSFVIRQVNAFRVAVKAMREAVRSEAIARHFAARIGVTMDHLVDGRAPEQVTPEEVRGTLQERYEELKDRAWASVLRSTEALNRLSSSVQRQAEAQFEQIKALEFTEANVYGFLLGLVQSQPEMQLEMMCEVFDLMVRYWSENTVFYKGWKSNDKHRTMGMRIKTTRIILPRMTAWSHSLDFTARQTLADVDKVFALLDGRSRPTISLVDLFERRFSELKHGQRLDASYFSVRYYKGAGTVHLYPRSKELIDRLNRVVGRRRAWLPPSDEQASRSFWKQYDQAEKFHKDFTEEVQRLAAPRSWYGGRTALIDSFVHRRDDSAQAEVKLAGAMDAVLRRHGLLEALEHDAAQSSGPLLLAA